LKLLAPFQMMNVFLYSRDVHAFDLYNEKIVAELSVIVDRYLAGAFVLDPFYDAVRSRRSTPPARRTRPSRVAKRPGR
ncbi:hypothetical protein ACC736_39760, partial [Rhizobium ruizarguesonis]